MKIKKISDPRWELQLLLESILNVDPTFNNVIRRMRGNNDIANTIYYFFGSNITTNMNYITLGDANDEVKFVNDTQVQRMLDAGRDPFTSGRNTSKIGRAVRQLLTANGHTVTDQQIQDFVNQYKVIWDEINRPSNIELVSGEDIRKWYHEDRYGSGSGQLNNSCMRYARCQPYLDIYAKNPESCQLVVLKNDDVEDPRVIGRALFWKASGGCEYYLDRIYTINDYDMDKIKNWIKKKFDGKKIWIFGESQPGQDSSQLVIKLEEVMFQYYPYFDTLYFLYPNSKELKCSSNREDFIFQLRETDGNRVVMNWKFSRAANRYLAPADAVYSDTNRDWYPTDECVRDYRNNLIWRNDAVASELYPPYISRTDAVTTEWGLIPSRELINVSITSTRSVRMPKIFEGDKFFKVMTRNHRYEYVAPEHAFFDMFGEAYSKSDKRYFQDADRSGNACIYKSYRINERDVVKLGEPKDMYLHNPGNVQCQVWALMGTTVPVAFQYTVTETQVATWSYASQNVNHEKIITGIIATEEDIELFGLTKKRAARGIPNPEIFMPKKEYMYDMYFHNPITEEFKKQVADLIPDELTRNQRIASIDAINTYLCGASNNYINNLRTATLRGISDDDLYRQVNKSIAKYWKTQNRTISTWFKNPTEALTRNSLSLNAMTNDFNGRQPCGIDKKFNTEMFKEWFTINREMFMCQMYLWCISGNREIAGKSAARKFGFQDRRSYAYLTNYSYANNSRNFGDAVANLCDGYHQYYRFSDGGSDPIAKFKLEGAYAKIGTLNVNNVLIEGLKAWTLFKSENLPDLLEVV